MPAECRSVLKACMAQFVLLDVCGNPVTGAASKLTTKGFIQVVATAVIEDGEEFTQPNACGELCIDERDDDEFRRYDLEMQFCQIDPEGLTLVSNARALVDDLGTTRGFAVGSGISTVNFSLELWTKVAGQACSVNGLPEWYYFALPWVTNGMVTDMTFENGPLNMTVTGRTRGAGDEWGRGPSCVLPSSEEAQSTDHLLGYVTDIQPPEEACGLQSLTGADLAC